MQMFFGKTCVICQADKLILQEKKTFLGLTSTKIFCCEDCGSVFMEDELRWKLVEMNDKLNPLWQQFRQKSFYVREWIDITETFEKSCLPAV